MYRHRRSRHHGINESAHAVIAFIARRQPSRLGRRMFKTHLTARCRQRCHRQQDDEDDRGYDDGEFCRHRAPLIAHRLIGHEHRRLTRR